MSNRADLVKYLTEVLLSEENLSMLQTALVHRGKPKGLLTNLVAKLRGTKVEVNGKAYYLSAHLAKIIKRLNEYNTSLLIIPEDLVISELQDIAKDWLANRKNIKVNKKQISAGEKAKSILHDSTSPPQYRLYASLYQITSPKELGEYSGRELIEKFLSNMKALSRDIARLPDVKSEKQDSLKLRKIPYLHPGIKAEDLELDGDRNSDMSTAPIKKDKISQEIKYGNEIYHLYKGGIIGKGSFGIVQLAQNARTGEWIAVKIDSVSKSHRIKSEINGLKDVDDFIFYQEIDKKNYIGMRLHPGRNLLDSLTNSSNQSPVLAQAQRLLIAKKMLKVAADIHSAKAAVVKRTVGHIHDSRHQRILHRDIKPSNLILDSSLTIKPADLAFSVTVADMNSYVFGGLMGTASYMAPELWNHDKFNVYNESTEVYALGISLMQVMGLADELPRKIIINKSLADKADPDLIKLINEMINEDPRKRPTVVSAYQRINAICSKNVNKQSPVGVVALAVSIDELLPLYDQNNPACFDEFVKEALKSGVNSISFYSDTLPAPSAVLIEAVRAFQRAGMLHIVPDVHYGPAEVVKESISKYYCRIFGTTNAPVIFHQDEKKSIYELPSPVANEGNNKRKTDLTQLISFLANVTLDPANLKMLQTISRKNFISKLFPSAHGKKVVVDGKKYYLHKHLADIVKDLIRFRDTGVPSPDLLVEYIRRSAGAELAKVMSKNVNSNAGNTQLIVNQVLANPNNSNPVAMVAASMYQYTQSLTDKAANLRDVSLALLTGANFIVNDSVHLPRNVESKPVKVVKHRLPYLPHKIKISYLNPLDGDVGTVNAPLKDERVMTEVKSNGETYRVPKNAKLGQGTFGSVYPAQNRRTGEWVAFKVMNNQTDDHVEKVVDNTKKAGQYLFHTKQDNLTFIGIKLYPGVSLLSFMHGDRTMKTPMAMAQKLLIAKRMLKATADLHNDKSTITPYVKSTKRENAKRMVHRDLKPQNMVIDAGLNVKLVDYDFALLMADKKEGVKATRVGTSVYKAPEISGERDKSDYCYTEKTEVFALGRSLELLFVKELQPYSEKYPELEHLIERMLATDPAERLTLNVAYSELNAIINQINKSSKSPSGLLAYAVSMQDVIKHYDKDNPEKLNAFVQQLVQGSGINSIAFFTSEMPVSQALLIECQRAFQKAGIAQIQPDVYCGKRADAIAAIELDYQGLFGADDVVVLRAPVYTDPSPVPDQRKLFTN